MKEPYEGHPTMELFPSDSGLTLVQVFVGFLF